MIGIALLFPPAALAADPMIWATPNGGCVVKPDGSIWHWGDGRGYTYPPPMKSGVAPELAETCVGPTDTRGVGTDGTMWHLGSGLPIASPAGPVWAQVSSKGYHSLAVKRDGSLWAIGQNFCGQLGNGTRTDSSVWIQVAADRKWRDVAGGGASSFAIAEDGTLWGWGNGMSYTPSLVDSRTCFVEFEEGFALDGTGSFWGVGPGGANPLPMSAEWRRVVSGGSHVLAIREDGTLWAWGGNSCCQLGVGDSDPHGQPTRVGNKTDWVDVSAGQYHSLGLDARGVVYAWGANWNGQLGFPAPEFGYTPIPMFDASSCDTPSAPVITSPSHPDESTWYTSTQVRVNAFTADRTWMRGYSYLVDARKPGNVDGTVEMGDTAVLSLPQGRHTVAFRGVDAGCDTSPWVVREFRCDTLPPVITCEPKPYYLHHSDLVIGADDGVGAGVASISYRIDNESTVTVEATSVVVPAGLGLHTVRASATDKCGQTRVMQPKQLWVVRPTSVSFTPLTVTRGTVGFRVVFQGALVGTESALANRPLRVEAAVGGGEYRTVASMSTDANGRFTFSDTPSENIIYRAVYGGDTVASYAPCVSSQVPVRVDVFLSAPTPDTVRLLSTRSFSLTGHVKPRQAPLSYPVRIYSYRYEDGKWRAHGYVSVCVKDVEDYSAYSVARRYTKGRWRVRAYFLGDAGHDPKWSNYSYFTVY